MSIFLHTIFDNRKRSNDDINQVQEVITQILKEMKIYPHFHEQSYKSLVGFQNQLNKTPRGNAFVVPDFTEIRKQLFSNFLGLLDSNLNNSKERKRLFSSENKAGRYDGGKESAYTLLSKIGENEALFSLSGESSLIGDFCSKFRLRKNSFEYLSRAVITHMSTCIVLTDKLENRLSKYLDTQKEASGISI